MCVTNKNSKHAVTHYTVLERFGNYTYVKCNLETGRTHQIRVHMASIGHPLLNDPLYGNKQDGEMYLQSYYLKFVHPITNKLIETSI